MNTKVKLRKRLKSDGLYHLYLDFYPPFFNPKTRVTQRQRFLGITLNPHPSTPEERRKNRDDLAFAERILSQVITQVRNDEHGFFNEDRMENSFIDYFEQYSNGRNCKSRAAWLFFKEYTHDKCRFKDLNEDVCNGFKDYLLNDAKNRRDGSPLHHNTAATYFIQFLCVLNAAFRDKYLNVKFSDYLKVIPVKASHRPYLTMEEAIRLHDTPCKYDVLRRASFFSILTGLRISDIIDLKWEDFKVAPDGGPCIIKVIKKTQEEKIIYINNEALSYCGHPYQSGPVFCGLNIHMTHRPLKTWVKAAGIEKDISFHCFRHTFATLQLMSGTDIYTVSHQLTHAMISTTQIYTELVDKKGRESANAISFLPEHVSEKK